MVEPDPQIERLERLRRWKVTDREGDYSLHFLKKQFKQQVERPHKQLAQIVELWQQHVPADLLEYTALEGLTRGMLRVSVDCSARLYQLDRLLRGGLELQLIRAYGGRGFRGVRLRVDPSRFERPNDGGEYDGHDDDQRVER